MRVNVGMVCLALISASAFWLLNALNKRYTTELNLPVTYDYVGEDLMVVEPPPERLTLSLTGTGWDLVYRKNSLYRLPPLVIALERPAVIKRLSKAYLMRMLREQLQPLRLNDMMLDTLYLDLQQRLSKFMLLRFDSASLLFASRCRPYTRLTLSVDTIRVSGAQRYVESLEDIFSLRYEDTDSLDEQFEQMTLPISFSTPSFLQAHPSEVVLSFRVGRYDRYSVEVPIERLNFPQQGRYRAVLSDTVVRLNYVVRSDQAELVKPELFTVVADYGTRDRRQRTLQPVLIQAPEQASEFVFEPMEIAIRYVRR